MRLYSTRDSARAGEPSVLAILETLAAMAASVWIGVHFNTWMHVAISAGIAPFLLLKTDESCVYALRYFERSLDRATRFHRTPRLGWSLSLTGTVLVSRLWGTLVQVLHRPTLIVRAVPANWWNVAVTEDSATSPEYLPYPEHKPDDIFSVDGQTSAAALVTFTLRGLRYYNQLPDIIQRIGGAVTTMLATILFVVPMVAVALACRLSIKSTALVWAPLLWALRPTKPAERDWKTQLSIDAELRKPQLVAAWSALCLSLVAVKYLLWAGQFEIAMKANALREALRALGLPAAESFLAEGVIGFVRPGAIPLWQVAVVVNSLLGLVLWWNIRSWLAHFKHGAPPADATITRTLSVTFFFRHLLTSYVILCDGYLAIQLARKLPLPEIGWKLFPWL